MGFARDMNYIKRIGAHPCKAGGLDIWIETGLRAGLTAVNSYAVPDCDDILVKAIEEGFKAGESGGHRHVNAKGGTRGNPTARSASQLLFEGLVRPARAVGNVAFIFGIGLSFVADWTSMLYAESGCDGPGFQYDSRPFSVGFVVVDPSPPGQNLLISGTVGSGCILFGFSAVTIPPGCIGTITYSASFKNRDPLHPSTVTTQLKTTTGRESAQSQFPPDPGDHGNATVGGITGFSGGLFLGESAMVNCTVDGGGGAQVTGGSISVSTHGRNVGFIPVLGCFSRQFT